MGVIVTKEIAGRSRDKVADIIYEFRLAAGEVCRLPRKIHTIRIVAGQAWVTFGGKDVILNAGDSTELGRGGGESMAVISALRHMPLVFETAA